MSKRETALSVPNRIRTAIRVVREHLQRPVRWEKVIDVAGGGTGLVVSALLTNAAKPASDIESYVMANLVAGSTFIGAGIIAGRAMPTVLQSVLIELDKQELSSSGTM